MLLLPLLKRENQRGAKPLFLLIPLFFKGGGIKRVPRKIEDFSGCLKGVRLVSNSAIINQRVNQ